MILADSFCRSAKARSNEFTTSFGLLNKNHTTMFFTVKIIVLVDAPLITQFAANTAHDFVGAAHMVAP